MEVRMDIIQKVKERKEVRKVYMLKELNGMEWMGYDTISREREEMRLESRFKC